MTRIARMKVLIRVIRTTNSLFLCGTRRFSCGKLRKLLRTGLLRGQESIDFQMTFRGQRVTMRFRDFPNQAVGPQHADLARDARPLAFQFCRIDVLRSEQQRAQVTVAESVDSELATIHGSQKATVVRAKGLQSADAAALPFGRLTKVADGFAQRLLVIHSRPSFEVAIVRLLTAFG